MAVTNETATEEQRSNFNAANRRAVGALDALIAELMASAATATFEEEVAIEEALLEAQRQRTELRAEFIAFTAEGGQIEPPDAATVAAVEQAAAQLDEMIANAEGAVGLVRGVTRLLEAYHGGTVPAGTRTMAASASLRPRLTRLVPMARGGATAAGRPSTLSTAARIIQPVAFVAGAGRRQQAPAYHEGMLLVKMRTGGAGGMAAALSPAAAMGARGMRMGFAAAAAAAAGPPSSGVAMLSNLMRSGAVRRVASLARQGPAPAGARALAAAGPGGRAAGARGGRGAGSRAADPNAGVSIVELHRDDDAARLQAACAADPNVEYVSRVPVRYIFARTKPKGGGGGGGRGVKAGVRPAAQSPPASSMWNLQRIQWEAARALPNFEDAGRIRVAVLDTGIDPKHPDLAKQVAGYVFAHPDLADVSGARDLIGHGTHVGGTIAASVNAFGVNGVCDCELLAWKIFDDVADFDRFNNEFVYFVEPVMYRRALADCLDAAVDVINLSIGGPGEPDPQEQELFDLLLANGTTIVAAMGNERDFGSPTSFPAAIPGVIAVGATTINDSVAEFSNAGNHISLSAPGVAIWSTLPRYRGQFGFEAIVGPDGQPKEGKPLRRERNYAAWNGTSMATPHVAGAAALLLAKVRAAGDNLTPAQVRDRLMSTADRVPDMVGEFDSDFGAGRLNLLKLLG